MNRNHIEKAHRKAIIRQILSNLEKDPEGYKARFEKKCQEKNITEEEIQAERDLVRQKVEQEIKQKQEQAKLDAEEAEKRHKELAKMEMTIKAFLGEVTLAGYYKQIEWEQVYDSGLDWTGDPEEYLDGIMCAMSDWMTHYYFDDMYQMDDDCGFDDSMDNYAEYCEFFRNEYMTKYLAEKFLSYVKKFSPELFEENRNG